MKGETKEMTEKEKLLGDLSREAIYTANTTPEYLEIFSRKISEKFNEEDFLILQLGSQFYESAKIRKNDKKYMQMQSIVNNTIFNRIKKVFPELNYSVLQRFKSAESEKYKRCERIFDEGRSPEIRDLLASKIIILEEESQETLSYEYKIVFDLMKYFSALNSSSDFPLLLNLAVPDKQVTKSSFSQEEHPNILIPDKKIIIPGLSVLGKDYISNPKTHGYQAFHISYELISKENPLLRIFSEIQVTTIAQTNYEPANHDKYKEKRNKRWDEVFAFDPSKVHIKGYYPQFGHDYSGLVKPLHVTEESKTF